LATTRRKNELCKIPKRLIISALRMGTYSRSSEIVDGLYFAKLNRAGRPNTGRDDDDDDDGGGGGGGGGVDENVRTYLAHIPVDI
jgi:hypothetical protein